MDTFPGLQQDCLDFIKKCNKVILAAQMCRTDCVLAQSEGVRIQCVEISRLGVSLGEFCEAFEHTTDHIGAA